MKIIPNTLAAAIAVPSLFVTAMMLNGCGATESDDVKTRAITANIEVIALGDGSTTVKSALKVGVQPLSLSASDSLIATANGTSQPLTKSNDWSLSHRWYDTRFSMDTAGTAFTVSFSRQDSENDFSSWVELPETIEYIRPQQLQQFNKSDDLVVEWAPSGVSDNGKITLVYVADCPSPDGKNGVHVDTQEVADTGVFEVPLATIIGSADEAMLAGNSCSVDLMIVRTKEGVLDEAFKGGEISAFQKRERKIIVMK